MNYILISSFIISLVLTYFILPMIKEMLIDSQVIWKNFRGEKIPTAMGLVFIFTQVITIGLLDIFHRFGGEFNIIYLVGYVSIGLVGFLDDLIGDPSVKGLKGHIRSVFNGKLTTGGIKAFFGLFISLLVSSYVSINILDLMINGLIIGLFTNLINLFDLRPGRSSKIFFLVSIVLISFNISNYNNYIIFSIYGILIPYISLDLNAKIMMGDTGANVLGYTLGIYTIVNFLLIPRIVILALLILIHVLAERISFSKIIEENKYLKYLDNLGR